MEEIKTCAHKAFLETNTCASVLQCSAVWCGVVQCGAVCVAVCVAVRCSERDVYKCKRWIDVNKTQ